jgi:hypothetical protein
MWGALYINEKNLNFLAFEFRYLDLGFSNGAFRGHEVTYPCMVRQHNPIAYKKGASNEGP